MLRVKNTTDDRSKVQLHRTASGFNEAPSFAGKRIMQGQSILITEDQYTRNKDLLDSWVAKGMVEITYEDGSQPVNYNEPKLDANGLKLGGPTFEVFTGPEHHYPPDMYPPGGWAEVPSAGLTAFRKKQKEDAEFAEALKVEEAEKAAVAAKAEADLAAQAASVITDALKLPSVTESILPPEPAGAPAVESDATKKSSGKKKLV